MSKKMMLLVALLGLLVPSVFAGTGPANIANTVHNLSISAPATSPYYSLNEDQICVFCHTPHGGTLDAPLWNRDLSTLAGAGKFQHYTSATLSSAVGANNRAVNNESLTCLSCHDGSIGVGDIINASANGTPDTQNFLIQTAASSNPGPRIGSSRALLGAGSTATFDLRDDHPISFSYSAVLADKPGTLQAVSYVETTQQLVLFGAAENVECATCHDPHVDYISNPQYDPFLAIPNTGSDLCLSCHIK